MTSKAPNYYVLKIESYDGSDTFLHCGDCDRDYLYCVVAEDSVGKLVILDNGYRSVEEAISAWPNARVGEL